jgi:hypothetical protein
MHRVRFAFGVCVAFVMMLTLSVSAGARTTPPIVPGVWTLIIPEAFEGVVFSWRIKTDGTYTEDGWYRDSTVPVQETLSGHWSVDGGQLTLTQDTLGYVFEGTIAGNSYYGELYLRGQRVSYFCALRGESPPAKCDPTVVQLQRTISHG